MALSLDVSKTGGVVVLQCRGKMVFEEESDELRRVILGLLNETKGIVLNLASITHIDSSGLDTLVASFISGRNRRAEIKFAAPSAVVHRLRRCESLILADRFNDFENVSCYEDTLYSEHRIQHLKFRLYAARP